MTYNHERFIRQALESVLSQKVDFSYEILISEDASTDHTKEIIQEYKKRYPDLIKLLLSEKNLHNNYIVVRGLKAARGKYIALLDGDDYWTSQEKLQQQVNFLDEHPECTICFHNALVEDQKAVKEPHRWTPENISPITTIKDLWLGNYIATSSTMYRNGVLDVIPEWYNDFFPITDWPLHLLNAEQGKIGYLNKVMSVYRYHQGGMYSHYSESRKQEETFKFYNNINRCLNYKYDEIINSAISVYFYDWADEYIKRNDYPNAKHCFKRYLSGKPFNKNVSLIHSIKLFIRLISIRWSIIRQPLPAISNK